MTVHVEVPDRRPPRHLLDHRRVAREEPACEREGRLFEHLAGGVDARDAVHGQHRAEDLVAQHGRLRREVGDHRGGAEPPPLRDRLPARHHAPLRGGLCCVALDPVPGLALDHRRDVGAERLGLAHLEHGRRPGEPLDQRLGHRLVRQDPRAGRALLARVHERRSHDRRDRLWAKVASVSFTNTNRTIR